MKIRLIKTYFIIASMACSLTRDAIAAEEGSDDTSANAYKAGWVEDSNGSTGGGHAFSGWHFYLKPVGTSDAGTFLGDSTKGSPGLDVNVAGKAFGIYGKNAKDTYCEAAAYRDFSSALKEGQTFSIDLAVNYRNGAKGIDIRGGSGVDNRPVLFTLAVASDNYAVSNAATGNGSTKWPYKGNQAIHLKLTQTTATGGTWKLTRGSDSAITGTYNGVATGIKLFCGNTDGTDADNLFANHLSIGH